MQLMQGTLLFAGETGADSCGKHSPGERREATDRRDIVSAVNPEP